MNIQSYREIKKWQPGCILKKSKIVEKEYAHKNNLLHLSTHLLMLNESGKLLCRKRSEYENRYNGLWTTSFGIHVELKNNYLGTLKKNLSTDILMTYCGEFKIDDGFENEICGLHIATFDDANMYKEWRYDRKFIDEEEIEILINKGETTPHLNESYKLLKNCKTILQQV